MIVSSVSDKLGPTKQNFGYGILLRGYESPSCQRSEQVDVRRRPRIMCFRIFFVLVRSGGYGGN